MLSISSGHSADYLLDAIATGRESYYTDFVSADGEGEPPGRWYGAGAESLGLVGEVNADVMRAVYGEFRDPRDPDGNRRLGNPPRNYPNGEALRDKMLAKEPDATPERQEEIATEAERMVRNNIGFYDATFSPPKSVTVVHAAYESQEVKARAAGDDATADEWAAKRELVEEAIWEGNRAQLDYLAEHAGYTRVGHHGGGAGRWVDAHAWTVASFFQHDSRNHDPQLHIHNAVLNRVEGPDGKWRTLSGQDLNLAKRGAGAVGDRTMFEHLAAKSGLPSAMRADGRCRELTGVDQKVMGHFSSRSQALTPKAAELAREYERAYGHAPNTVQMHRFNQRATLATRPAKEHTAESSANRLARWDQELRTEIGSGLAAVAETVSKQEPPEPRPFDMTATLETAVAAAQASDSRFTLSSTLAEIDATLPNYLGGLSGAESHAMLRAMAELAVESDPVLSLRAEEPGADTMPAEFRLDNGRSSFIQPESDLFATKEHVRSERALQAAAVERGAAAMSPELAEFFTTELAELGIELGVDQRAAVHGVLTDGAKLATLVGAAGAGKGFTLGVITKAWEDPTLWNGEQHRVIGLATAQIAADELAAVGISTRNVAAWLAAQERLTDGSTFPPDQELAVRPGDLVVLDEASMVDHANIARIRELVDAAGGKTLLAGDHRQLAAIGAGGSMGLVTKAGTSYELTEVRRFDNEWEAAASLQLREGDPAALHEYRKHGRIIDGGTREQTHDKAVRGYLADYLVGRDTRLLADTNEEAGSLSASVRAELVRLGRVAEDGVELGKQGTTAGVGDLVEARKLAWDLAGYDGNRRGPVNRERYTVTETRADGSIVVDHAGERLVLPDSYVREHLSLAYANTVHAVEGATVDTAWSVATPHTGRAAEYVALTRGTERNIVCVETISVPADSPPGAVHDAVHRDPVAVLAGSLELAQPDRAAVEEIEASAAEMGSVVTAGERFACVSEMAVAGRTAALLDRLTDEGKLTDLERRRLAADQGTPMLSTLMRQVEVAGHDPERVLTEAVTANSLDSARSIASVLHDRVTRSVSSLEPKGDSHENWVPRVADPAMTAHLQDLAKVADDRRDVLGEQAVTEGPQWAVEALGAVPDEEAARAQWTRSAGVVAAHRERTGHDAEGEALPSPPSPGRVEEYASWWAGWRALGRPDTDVEERELSDGQLRMRVRAMEREAAWQPRYVARELSGTSQAAERERQTAVIRGAEAGAATDDGERARLEAEAAEAQARAEELAEQAKQLEHADTVRAMYYARTAGTRAADQRARLELSRRGVDLNDKSGLVTARELLEAQALGIEVDDLRREITSEHDLTDVVAARSSDAAVFTDRVDDSAETALTDIRETTQHEPARTQTVSNWERVPDSLEVTEDEVLATRAGAEMDQRTALDRRADEHDQETPARNEDVDDEREVVDMKYDCADN